MKLLITLTCVFALNSCNTCIGIGRDVKQGYYWTKDKIQGTGSDNGGGDVAPVY